MSQENIKVVVRFRPLNDKDNTQDFSGANVDINTTQGIITIDSEEKHSEFHQYKYDHVFDQNNTQESIFTTTAQHAVEWVVDGYNATIFTYGPTGTGKTYTMFGREENPGIIPRACALLFELLSSREDIAEFTVKCSFLEIYRETLNDLLLTANSTKKNMRIRQDKNKGIYVQNSIEKFVYTSEDILSTIDEGAKHRAVSATALNHVSSRSHAVLTLNISQLLDDGTQVQSKLHMIDLAGSENVEKSEVQGISLLEAQMINKSLSCLGNVINALTEKGRGHIPYRDSRLTYLLQDSLGGNAKTILIVTASPCEAVASQTLSTLKFANRAKQIKNIPKVNRDESRANLVKTVELLKQKLVDLQAKYDECSSLLENIEKNSDNKKSKELTLLQGKCERLEKSLEKSKKNTELEKEKYILLKSVFDKQRKLAEMVSQSLYEERLKNNVMENDVSKYHLFIESLKDCVENPDIMDMVVKNHLLKKSLIIDTNLSPISVDIDSPV